MLSSLPPTKPASSLMQILLSTRIWIGSSTQAFPVMTGLLQVTPASAASITIAGHQRVGYGRIADIRLYNIHRRLKKEHQCHPPLLLQTPTPSSTAASSCTTLQKLFGKPSTTTFSPPLSSPHTNSPTKISWHRISVENGCLYPGSTMR